jgi:hypothetical protein
MTCYGARVVDWYFLAGAAGLVSLLVAQTALRRRHKLAAASASGLAPVADLTHVTTALQRSALWSLSDGGFERRVVHGTVVRNGSPEGAYRTSAAGSADVDITAFDLETLRERRGEWAYLPVEPPFRIGGVVSVVVCEIDRKFPHVLFKRTGTGDEMIDDDFIERAGHIAKNARDRLGLARSYPAELSGLPAARLEIELPVGWRVYTTARAVVDDLVANGFRDTLTRADRRDLVVELIEDAVIVYPAARVVVGPDAFADLTSTALAIVDGVLAGSRALSPRGVEVR